MARESVRRGFHPEDPKLFSRCAIDRLARAQTELQWLMDRGYPIGPASEFIGNHYQLALRQRIALRRATASSDAYRARKEKQLAPEQAFEGPLLIDGFNLVITLEVALSGSPLLRCGDGATRDLAGLRGTYRLIGRTSRALDLVGAAFKELEVPQAVFYLDAPVSNSGRLKQRLLQTAAGWDTEVSAFLVPNADKALEGKDRVVSCDSAVIDASSSWINLAGWIIDRYIGNAWIVRLMSNDQQAQ